jgi:hypothetical protein
MTGVTHSGKHKIFWGCLVAVVLAVILIVVAAISWSAYWYEQDNAARRDPMENLADFHTKLQSYLSAHEGKYPAGQGAEGLGELQVYLPYLRVKDDKVVEINPDIFTEHHTSYAYVASGLNEKDLDDEMPVIFEKPWNRKRVRVLLKNGRIEVLENSQLNNCRQVVEYYRKRSQGESPVWETLRRNAEYIDR